MAGRLAIDFGTSNTRVALWDEALGRAIPLAIPDVSLRASWESAEGEFLDAPYIPSLINYSGKHVWIGKQVRDRGLTESPATFRWMKRYISNRLEIPRRVDRTAISTSRAGADFLVRILVYAAECVDLGDEEIAFTVPVESFEHYQEWLSRVAESAGIHRFRLLDEASAAALGYGLQIGQDRAFMVFDFGGGTLDVSVVRVDATSTGPGRCCVLGKAGVELGGATIDQWLYKDVVSRNRKHADDVRHMSTLLLMEVERAKERLTSAESADVVVLDPTSGEVLEARYTRTAFEDLLEEHGLFETLQGTVNRALAHAAERGYLEDRIEAVLLVGGSSLIPSVRRAVRQMFGRKVKVHRPLDAVSLGAAAFVHGVDFSDHIQHDYALRYYNREKGEHDFLLIVPAGTPYPSEKAIRTLTVSGSYGGQEFLGIDIYEVGNRACAGPIGGFRWDLVFDPSGCARFREREKADSSSQYWVNETCPTFIRAQPPAERGDKRFLVAFAVDGNRRLCITVTDTLVGRMLLKDHPVVKLT